jgi:hypothetical protein
MVPRGPINLHAFGYRQNGGVTADTKTRPGNPADAHEEIAELRAALASE